MAQVTERIRDYLTSTTIKHAQLMSMLSEFLAVEQGGQKLYQKALAQVRDPDVVKRFQTFYEQTVKHEQILTRIISELGGDPTRISPTARIAASKAQELLATMERTDGLTPAQIELNAMENILLAETKDHADWELLGKIARQTTEPQLSSTLKPAVDEVESEEEDHLNWTGSRMAELSMKALSE
jgi:rubrerythrin